MATAFGVHAVKLAAEKRYGRVVGLRGSRITDMSYDEINEGTRSIAANDQFVEAAEAVGICLGR